MQHKSQNNRKAPAVTPQSRTLEEETTDHIGSQFHFV